MTKEEILEKHLNVMLVEHSNDYKTVEVMSEQPEYKIILEAMEEYALQQVKDSGIIPPVSSILPKKPHSMVDEAAHKFYERGKRVYAIKMLKLNTSMSVKECREYADSHYC